MSRVLIAFALLVLPGCLSTQDVQTARGVVVVNSVTLGFNWTTLYVKQKAKSEEAPELKQ